MKKEPIAVATTVSGKDVPQKNMVTLNFEVLRDRWSPDKFISIYKSQLKFTSDLDELLTETLVNNDRYSPEVRASIIRNMLEFFSKKLDDDYWLHRKVTKKYKDKVFSAIIDLLGPGFSKHEITVDLLGLAPNLQILDAILEAGVNPNSKYQSDIERFTEDFVNSNMFDRLVEAGANHDLLVDGKIRIGLLEYKFLKKIFERGELAPKFGQGGGGNKVESLHSYAASRSAGPA